MVNYVRVYSKENCMQCKMLKRWLEDKGINFTECDITHNEEELKHLRLLGYQSLPVTYIDNGRFNGYVKGFDVKKLNDVLLGDK